MTPTDLTRRHFARACAAGSLAAGAAFAGPQAQPELKQAMESVTAAIAHAESDPDRPVYHFQPPANWNNDPNGTIFYRAGTISSTSSIPTAPSRGHHALGTCPQPRPGELGTPADRARAARRSKGEAHIFSGGAISRTGRPARASSTPASGIRDPGTVARRCRTMTTCCAGSKSARNPVLTSTEPRRASRWRMARSIPVPRSWTHLHGLRRQPQRGRGGGGAVQFYDAANPALTEWTPPRCRLRIPRSSNLEYRVSQPVPARLQMGASHVAAESLRVFCRQPRPRSRQVHARHSRRTRPRQVLCEQHLR